MEFRNREQHVPQIQEIKRLLEKMPDWKAPGPDSIQAGVMKAGGPAMLCLLHALITRIAAERNVPRRIKESVMLLMNKNGS